MKNEKIQLSISLLVSNTIDTIKNCMDSLVPILNSIPSELIIVDTGGTDGSIEVARQYTDKIVPFTWCHDFAKARNAGLEKARGEWFMFLDDDEWFEDPEEIIQFFKSGEYLKYNCASYAIRNYRDKSGTTWNETRYTRMVKMEKNTKFISPIHEIIDPTYSPEKYLDCYVHHYGYAFDNEEEKRKHAERNLILLEKVLETEKTNHRLTIQLAQEYGFILENEKSIEISRKDLEVIDKKVLKLENDIIYAGWHMNNIINLEILINNKEESYKAAKQYFDKRWINVVTKNNLTHVLSRLSFEFKKDEDCITYLNTYLETYDKIQRDQNIRLRQTITDQCRSYNEENYFLTLLAGFKSANRIDREKKRKEYVERLSKTKFFLTTAEDFTELINYIFTIEDKKERNQIMSSLLKNDKFRAFLAGIMNEDSVRIPKEEVMEVLADHSGEYKELLSFKIIISHRKNEEVKEYMDQYFEKEKNILFLNPEIMDVFVNKIDILDFVNQISLEEWMKNINVFMQKASTAVLLKIGEICKKYTGFHVRLYHLKECCYEKLLKSNDAVNMDFLKMEEILSEYVKTNLGLFKNIYNEEIFQSELEVYLPKSTRFCNKINGIYKEGLDNLSKARIIREAVDLYPTLASFCKVYIDKMQEETNAATNEFLKLAARIKQSIRTYLVLGQVDNARITLEQLEKLIPNDPEIVELKKQLV